MWGGTADRSTSSRASRARSSGSRPMSSIFLSAPGRPRRADRGRGRSGEGSHPRRQGQALRHVGSGRRNNPSRPRRPAGDGGSERIFAMVEAPRRGSAAHSRGTRNRVRSHSPLGKGFLTEKSAKARRSPVPTSATPFLALSRMREKQIRPWLISSPRSRDGRRRRPHKSRSPGCLPRSRGSCRSRAPRSSPALRRTSERLRSRSHRTICVRSIARPRRSWCKGPGTRNIWSG